MKINILTIFPEMFSPLNESMLGRAREKGILQYNIVNIRDYTEDKHNRVDDTPFGGGPGMVMQYQPVIDAFRENKMGGRVIYMSPRGQQLTGKLARDISQEEEITILCGHYEGVDQRILDELGAQEITIGDYVVTGGELPAMILIDASARFIEGVLSSNESVMEESVYSGLLEYPQYTRPRSIDEREVPEILLSGDHGAIDIWRLGKSMEITGRNRPEMLEEYLKNRTFTKKEKKALIEMGFSHIIENHDRK
ncbi:MAG: tRNA (guanosine(37)-N1)-methyltransferase TrmD [Baileyella intestinalis]|uniref:tRNA (guanosine(37)-N1)-methyltransferase TrmD n=1 Tax=Baileyella intestinalis TaxID=2606709 RepID=UPI0023F3B084|nr:tRNA (guanosine(37)-N1)-methyltransferase TrmD [Baileyella intestinalis]MDD5874282.1 tRNA (guanosine(37)-N1)-methyltransferase TrmD [Baileyella intestinalis]